MFEIKGKNAIVTGGASGIGYQCVKYLLEKGAKNVAIFDMSSTTGTASETQFNREYGSIKVHFFCMDVSNEDLFKEGFKRAVGKFGSLEIIINAAGIFDDSNWEKEINVNLTSLIRSTIMGIEHMGVQAGGKGGVIINIASVAGLYPFYLLPIYSATKFGVVGASMAFGDAKNYELTKVRVISICPSVTNTSMTAMVDIDSKFLWKELKTDTFKQTLMPNGQRPESVATGIMSVIENASSGTIWICKNDKPPQEVNIKSWINMKLKSKM